MADTSAATRFEPGKKFGDWVVLLKLDEGGFGHVYKVEHRRDKGKLAALKAEPNDVEGGSAIKLETQVLDVINKSGPKPHVPLVFQAAKHKKFCYMVMTLLGDNLKALKTKCGTTMPEESWCRLGIQALYSVKLVHDYGYIHRDIKPNNFVFGYSEDPERARMLHILDFGLSRSYALQKGGKWHCRRARGTAEFRGTLRYCSPNIHERKEQGRHDDLWSMFYVLIELHYGLPWQTVEKDKIELMKKEMKDQDVSKHMPPEMQTIMPYLRTLNCYQRPDYSMFYDALVKLMKRLKVSPDDPYAWETKEDVAKILKEQSKKPAWEDAGEFFKSDPIGINGPPKDKDHSTLNKTGEDMQSQTKQYHIKN